MIYRRSTSLLRTATYMHQKRFYVLRLDTSDSGCSTTAVSDAPMFDSQTHIKEEKVATQDKKDMIPPVHYVPGVIVTPAL